MPGHDFEHNVQRKMEELRISPSDAVWNGVENEIRKNKRKRRVLFLMPLLLVFGIGAYWAIQPSSPSSIAEKNTKPDSNDKSVTQNPATHPVTPPLPETGDPGSHSTDAGAVKNIPGGQDLHSEPAHPPQQSLAGNGTSNKETKRAPGVGTKRHYNKFLPSAASKNTAYNRSAGEVLNNNKKQSITRQNDTRSKEADIKDAVIADVAKDDINAIDKSKEQDAVKKEEQVATNTDTLAAVPTIETAKEASKVASPGKARESKWQFGFQGGAGVSKLASGFSAFSSSRYMDVAGGITNNNNPQPPNVPAKPATLKDGFSWNAGLFVQRSLGNRLKISAALQYMLYSTNSNIGSRVDSIALFNNNFSTTVLVSRYYRNGRDNNYHSRYHLVELPVSLQVQLNRSKQLPFHWSSGFSIGYLTSSNGLQYDGSTGYYYKDDELFQRVQYGFHTGLSLTLFNKSKHPLEIGPQFHYKFSDILKNSSDRRHLLGGSLAMRWYLSK